MGILCTVHTQENSDDSHGHPIWRTWAQELRCSLTEDVLFYTPKVHPLNNYKQAIHKAPVIWQNMRDWNTNQPEQHLHQEPNICSLRDLWPHPDKQIRPRMRTNSMRVYQLRAVCQTLLRRPQGETRLLFSFCQYLLMAQNDGFNCDTFIYA